MKVSMEIDNNFGYEKITQLVDNIPLIGISVKRDVIVNRNINVNRNTSVNMDFNANWDFTEWPNG